MCGVKKTGKPQALQYHRSIEFSYLTHIFSVLLFALSITILIYSIPFRWQFFTVRKIKIMGNSHLPADYIRKLYGLDKRWSIFELEGEREILDPAIRRVKGVIVSHDQLNFMIEERKKTFIMHVGQNFYLSDEKGILFRRLKIDEDPYSYHLPIICGLNKTDFIFGKLSRNGLVKKLDYMVNLDKTLLKNMSEIDIKSNVVYMRKGIVFRVKDIKSLEEIPGVFLKIWKTLPTRSRVEMITNDEFVFER